MTVLGIVTARGGSKGIPRKNVRPLGGKPLIVWTIEAARASALLTETVVSTDDDEIASVAREAGARVPFMRPAELASDTAGSIPVVQHAIEWMKEHEGKKFDAVMILQPTSPFRTAEDIDASIRLLEKTNADSVMSMVKLTDMALKKLKKLEGDRIVPLIEEEGSTSSRRNDLSDIYKRNTAIYLTKTAIIMAGDLFGNDSRAYIMPPLRSLDINAPFDFKVAEGLVCAGLQE